MRSRRSSRRAAVVLAGCVGLAVMAPGLALAAPISGVTSEAECTDLHGTWSGGVCDDGTPTTTAATTADDTTSTDTAGSPSSPAAPSTAPSVTTPESSATEQQGTDGTLATTPDAVTPGATGTGSATTAPGASEPANAGQETEAGASRLQGAVDGATGTEPAALLPQDALDALRDGLGFDIPTSVPAGGFGDPQESCAYLVSKLQVPSDVDAVSLAGQLGQFCASLPADALDPSALTGLIERLRELLGHLIPSLPSPGVIPDQPPHTVPAAYWGYWTHHYDVDCPELTYEEANAILAGDPSDPFRLDADDDGVACEENAHGDAVADVDYEGYPVGGVATGDGSTHTGATGVKGAEGAEVALAAGALAGLGLTGLVLVRRFAREG